MTIKKEEHVPKVRAIVEELKNKPGALLPILHEIQNQLGYVPPEIVPTVAEGLNLSRAEVHGVISFYHHFSKTPRGRNIVEFCRAESCQAMGARGLEAELKQKLGIDFHQTTADGEITLEPVYCLGNCACSPSLKINGDVHGRLTSQDLNTLIDDVYTTTVELK